jgi:acyl-CoA synthetase (AMP-forming)/AMP-acid ligase II
VLDAAATWDGDVPGRGRVRIVCAGAPPPTRMIQRIDEELGWEFLQIYGLTETSPIVTFNRARAADTALPARERARRLGRAGAPALGVQMKISDVGEVLVRSNVVLDRYWANPDATSEALASGWFHTGDGGTIDDEGHLTISDRKKDVIITGGENVSSIEVEDCISHLAEVAEVAVIGVPDEKWGETIKALVVRAPGAEIGEQDIVAHCKQRLAGFKAPTTVEFRDAIPRTATGKVQKFRLREPYWAGRQRGVN